MAWTEDPSEFFDDFTEPATISGLSCPVDAMYDREYVELEGEVGGYRPVLTCSTDDVVDVDVGDSVTVGSYDGTLYVVQKIKIDTVETKLILGK